jgi:hypothetical protein
VNEPEVLSLEQPETISEPVPQSQADIETVAIEKKDDAVELSEVEVLRLENERQKTEIAALKLKEAEIRQLAEAAKLKTTIWEQLKEQTKDANESRIEALEGLAALARGDVQMMIFDKEDIFPGGGASFAPTPGNDHRAVVGTYRAMQFTLTLDDLNKCDATNIIQLEPEASKRKVVAVEALAGGHYLPAYQHIFEDGSGYFDCWPLLERSEWDTRLAETFGEVLADLSDVEHRNGTVNETGGAYAGLVVKVGRKKFVVGPDSEVIRLVYGPDGLYAQDGCIAAAMMGK